MNAPRRIIQLRIIAVGLAALDDGPQLRFCMEHVAAALGVAMSQVDAALAVARETRRDIMEAAGG